MLLLVQFSCRSCCTTTHIHRCRTVPANRYWWQSVPRFNLSSQIEEPCEVGVGANKTLLGVSQVFSSTLRFAIKKTSVTPNRKAS
jgi:hypothetical protein